MQGEPEINDFDKKSLVKLLARIAVDDLLKEQKHDNSKEEKEL